ncbi:hypothetical protein H6F44_20410 [Pseudanabaena sp. FACHB-1277]|jgi:hypothetical protein|uniref:Uncharacterized protein n=1 Tax=Pseudanabaena cinerea FACHB-1277 TaxID=2949581 RepID=A0A926UWE7_9CYAN|nr:hypothetical protein [Pseudanabaena cinerea]MBD2152462.1 hypothetical protein [Pseudanabaena cinerea FACHB-1277]
MTTLINLESYLECCQYAHLFGENVAKLIPNPKSLPNTYRDFCKKHLSQAFLPVPALVIAQPQTLSLRTKSLSQAISHIGFTIDDQRDDQIFIVREANSLKMRSFDVPQYLYANVYRYWSYASQLTTLTNSDKPLVIYDLDSFTPAQIIPFRFESSSNSIYKIPIIDTRSQSQYDGLKLSQSYETIYDTICYDLAGKIISDLGIESGIELENIIAIFSYIQKINLFQKIIPQCSSDRIPMIIEIGDTFYPYNLNLSELEKIVCKNLPIPELQNIITQNSNSYNFALVSSLIQLPILKQDLQQQFSTVMVDTSQNIFSQIWQQKIDKNFPLYGQHLDNISFFVARDKETIEISLPSINCYEGEQEKIQYASYLKNGKEEREFTLPIKSVNLQFKINGEPFISSETDKEQSYFIENQYFQETENNDVKIKIRFRTKPGITPKLEVLDNQNRVLHSKLVDYEHPVIESSRTSGFLPMAQILESRTEKSNRGLEIIHELNYISALRNFANSIARNIVSRRDIAQKISNFRSEWKDRVLPVKIKYQLPNGKWRDKISPVLITTSPNFVQIQNELRDTLEIYQSIARSFSSIFPRLTFDQNDDENTKKLINKSHSSLILIIGDSYAMTQFADLDFLHGIDILSRRDVRQWDERLRSAAKTACTQSRQIDYFNLFYRTTEDGNTAFYTNGIYLWGYARILMWYMDFKDLSVTNICKQHFNSLIIYCNSLNGSVSKHESYLRDVLIALIYLMTFRESDPEFVKKDSSVYGEAKSLCRKLDPHPIRSQKTIIEVPLNSFFDQLLDGNVTQEQVRNMIEID